MHGPRDAYRPSRSQSRGAAAATPDIQLQRIAAAPHRVDAISSMLPSPVFPGCDTARATPDRSCARAIYGAFVFALLTILGRVGIVLAQLIFPQGWRCADRQLPVLICASAAVALSR